MNWNMFEVRFKYSKINNLLVYVSRHIRTAEASKLLSWFGVKHFNTVFLRRRNKIKKTTKQALVGWKSTSSEMPTSSDLWSHAWPARAVRVVASGSEGRRFVGPSQRERRMAGGRIERHRWEEEDLIGLTAAGRPRNNVGSISVWFPASCERLLPEKNEKAPPCCEVRGQRRSECSFISDKDVARAKNSLIMVTKWFMSGISCQLHQLFTSSHSSSYKLIN